MTVASADMRRVKEVNPDGRSCTACGEFKPWDEYHKMKAGHNGHYPKCKPCQREYLREHRYPEAAQRWREANPEKVKSYSREYYARTPEKRRAAVKRWKEENHLLVADRNRLNQHRRRIQKGETAVGPIDVEALYAGGNLCGICGEPIEEPPHIDHIVPLACGGPHITDNLQLAHAACNLRKGART